MVLLVDCNVVVLIKVFDFLLVECSVVCEIDVLYYEDVCQMVEFVIECFGCIDVLVSDVGIFVEGDIIQVSLEDWYYVQVINVNGVFYGVCEVMFYLEKMCGCIVNVVLVLGLGVDWNLVVYNIFKGVVVNFICVMVLDFGCKGICVNVVCFSFIFIGMIVDVVEDEEQLVKFVECILFGCGVDLVEIVFVIVFLVSFDVGFVIGVNFLVDGGVIVFNGQLL